MSWLVGIWGIMQNLFELLERAYHKNPDKIAIVHEKYSYTYREYYINALKIARGLSEAGVLNASDSRARRKPIVVIVDDNPQDLFAFLAIMSLGHFYVPVGANMPVERLSTVLARFDVDWVLINSKIGLPGKDREPKRIQAVKLYDLLKKDYGSDEELIASTEKYLARSRQRSRQADGWKRGQGSPDFDSKMADYAQGSSIDKAHSTIKSDPAFGMFTSGSTGKPKLVLKSHGSILDMCGLFVDTFGFTEDDVFGNQQSLEFDGSIKSVFLALYLGATVSLIPTNYMMFPKLLVDTINATGVTRLIWSTYGLKKLHESNVFESQRIHKVKTVMFSGEEIPRQTLIYWMRHLSAEYYNLYAPTEVSFNCTYYKITVDNFDDYGRFPIGRELEGCRIMIINEDGKEAEVSEDGELYIMGAGLALGYYGDAELTAKAFVQNPLNDVYSEIVFKSGDLGYRNEEGLITYIGRLDHQIKHQGYRVELGEIEHALMTLKGVRGAACIYDKQKEEIVAFIEGEPVALKVTELVHQLERLIPKYMIPTRFIIRRELPLNRNNKIDIIALKLELGL